MLVEIRQAVCRLARTRGFTVLAVLTLALGIGASTALFSLVNGVLLRPLAYRQPGELVWLRESMPAFGTAPLPVNAHHFLTWRERATTLAGISVLDGGGITLTGGSQPEQLALASVSAGFFELLGVAPALGRSFAPEEETSGHHRVVVISDALWRRSFGADPAVIGRQTLLDHEPHVIIGVLPARFRHPQVRGPGVGSAGPDRPDLYRPKFFPAEELREKIGRHNYGAIARLHRGVSLDQALAELNQIDRDIVREAGHPDAILRAQLLPLQEAIVGPARRGLLVLFGAVTSVLLIGCVNLMNFLLARAESRQHDAAIRQALGATRGRLIRQALIEALLVAGAGGLLGIGLAHAGLSALLRHVPTDLPRTGEIHLDGAVLLFALGTTVVTGLLFGALPAWRLSRADPQQALASSGRTLAGGAGHTLASALVATEVTLSLVLLTAATLFGLSFARLIHAPQGFTGAGVLTAEITIPITTYVKGEQRVEFFERVLERLAGLPGVTATALVNTLPLQGENWVEKAAAAGDPRPPAEKPNVNVRFVNRDYFEALGIPLRGRGFAASDRDHPVGIISAGLAETLWPGQDPIGRRVERWPGDEYEVIGVAGDVKVAANRTPVPTVYRPYWVWPPRRMIVAVRTSGDPRAAAPGMRQAVHAVDPDVPLPEFRTIQDLRHGSVAQQRFQLLLAVSFASVAILLTALGIYGVVAYSVTRRRRELGIRLALGATGTAVQRLVIRQGMRPVWIGLILGAGIAVALGRILESLLFETSARDPWTLASVTLGLAVVAALACYLPGRRVTGLDPVSVLRAD